MRWGSRREVQPRHGNQESTVTTAFSRQLSFLSLIHHLSSLSALSTFFPILMAPKTKSAPANGANGASQKHTSATPSGTSSPATVAAEVQEFTPLTYGTGRPDKAQYDAEQNKIKAEIDALQVKLVGTADMHYVGLREASFRHSLFARVERSQGQAQCRKGRSRKREAKRSAR